MSKHTPGPFEAAPDAYREFWTVYAPDPSEHASAGDLMVVADNLTEGNARLFAAAPDLLEACKSAVFRLNEISNLLTGDPAPEDIQRAYDMAYDGLQRAAIAKAEGK